MQIIGICCEAGKCEEHDRNVSLNQALEQPMEADG